MSKDIIKYADDEATLDQVAKELAYHVYAFKDIEDKKDQREKEKIGNIDYEFDKSKGKVVSTDANTWISFDLDSTETAYKFMKAMHAHDIQEDITEDEKQKIDDAVAQIAHKITHEYSDLVREALRKAVIGNVDSEAIPLETISIYSAEIVDYEGWDEESKYTLKFAKYPDATINMQNVQSRLLELKEENPEKSIPEFIKQEQTRGNPTFEGIAEVYYGHKFLWDVCLIMFVDYSFSDDFLLAAKEEEE